MNLSRSFRVRVGAPHYNRLSCMELTAVVSKSHTMLHLKILEGGAKLRFHVIGGGASMEANILSDLGNNIHVRLDTMCMCVCVCVCVCVHH